VPHPMACSGHESDSGLYYEILKTGSSAPVPILMIHGGGATGACFRTDLAGGLGWADQLAERGYEVWVTDWPGCGRSQKRRLVDIDYADVVSGYRRLLRDVVRRPVVVVPHSMGGAIAWQLVEHERDLVVGVVALAASYPTNITSPKSTVLHDNGRVVRARFDETGVEFVIDREHSYIHEDDYIVNQAIATSTRFPPELVGLFRAGFTGVPPKMMLQRIGVLPGLPAVENIATFTGVPIRLISGTEDPVHRLVIERATATQFQKWGADASIVHLGDIGIVGNGHFFFFENNQRDVLNVVEDQINSVIEQNRGGLHPSTCAGGPVQ
jgi:pimeloyl-ACP methyl ester carboxylesterase